MEKNFKIIKEDNQIWLIIEIEDKRECYCLTKANLNKLRSIIEDFLEEEN